MMNDGIDNNKNDNTTTAKKTHFLQRRRRYRISIVAAVVLTINALDRITGMGSLLHSGATRFWHLPKIILAAVVYVAALYYDCQWTLVRGDPSRSVTLRFGSDFGPRVVRALVRILPLYPILAVLASFGFLFVITAFEWLHWSTDLLNWPIYYGTLYGPFSYIYWTVKSQVVDDYRNTSILPTSTPPRRLGSM